MRNEAPFVTEELNFPSINSVLHVLIFKVLLLNYLWLHIGLKLLKIGCTIGKFEDIKECSLILLFWFYVHASISSISLLFWSFVMFRFKFGVDEKATINCWFFFVKLIDCYHIELLFGLVDSRFSILIDWDYFLCYLRKPFDMLMIIGLKSILKLWFCFFNFHFDMSLGVLLFN